MARPATEYGLTRSEADAVGVALHIHRSIGADCRTGRTVRLETMRRLEALGIVEETWGCVVDGDGFTVQPERYRRCFALTSFGLDLAEQIDAAEWHEFAAKGGA